MAKLHYLHFDLVEEWEIDTAMLDTITKKYSEIVRDIEDRRFHTNMGEDRFPANENPACKRCPYMSVCPLRAHMHMDDEVLVGESTVKTLVDEYAQLSAQASDIDKQKKAIKAALSTYLRHHKLQKLYGEHHQLSATPTTHRSIADAAALRKYLQEQGLLEQYLQLDRHALTRAIKDTDLDPTALGESMQQKESVTLRVSKKKA